MEETLQLIPQNTMKTTVKNYMPTNYEMNKFLETYKLLSLNQEEIENLRRLEMSKDIEAVIKILAQNKSPGPNDVIGEFY